MKLLDALNEAAKPYVSWQYSLFHVSATGSYTTLLVTAQADSIVRRFKEESLKPETVGLEVRCNGMRVQFDGT